MIFLIPSSLLLDIMNGKTSSAPSEELATIPGQSPLGQHYDFNFRGYRLDPYAIFSVYTHITGAEHQHAIKKLLRMGRKEAKPAMKDLDEVILTLNCWKRRLKEEEEYANRTASDSTQGPV
jgi:hypothetical protein